MKIFTAAEIQAWDEYTIREEPVNSIDLMERAAERCVEWIEKNISTFSHFNIYCGKGNNGGDGLAIARLLAEKGNEVQIHILEFGTDDFQQNLARLHQYPTIQIQYIQSESHIYPIREGGVVIDALYGTGLNRKLEGLAAQVVQQINKSPV
jgi:NAD(P)H-hydrate epimerase